MKLLRVFDLEKKADGCYRCKGGWLADVVFLSWGIVYILFRAILSLFRRKK